MTNTERRIIAVDFDGTIVENRYPQMGRERPFALRTLRALQEKGFLLILWTCRMGAELDEAVEFCRCGGVEFYAVNANYEGETPADGMARKLTADIFIDDRNLGGVPSWGDIYQQLTGENNSADGRNTTDNKQNLTLLERFARILVGR